MTEPRLVGNRYELGALLGYGGMAEVHLGRDIRLGRQVAVKVLRVDLARDPSFQTRFRREAQSAGGLNHPAIVAVYDTGEDQTPEGNVPYIVMEYVDGRTLRDVLSSEGRLEPNRAMEIVGEVCAALDFSHRHGIVHRDIKPANVMITKTGAVKVMDFGIARALADDQATVTQTAAVIGTAQYLSPEQARGEPVDARSDVYSTGCLLYELVTGHPPFQGDSPVAVAYQHVRESATVPSAVNPAVPRSLDSIVMKALAKNPLNRYQSAADMRADLQRAIADRPVVAEPVLNDDERTQLISRSGGTGPDSGVVRLSEGYDDRESSRRTALIWVAIVVALLLVIGGTAYALVSSGGKDKAAKVTMVTVPTLVGVKSTQVAALVTTSQLQLAADPEQVNTCADATVLVGQVCTQDPPANTVVAQNTPVTVTIYIGPQTATVPFLVGKTLDAAIAAIDKLQLTPDPQPINNSAPVNQIVKQDPDGGTLKLGSKVTLYYSTGKVKIPDVAGLSDSAARSKLNLAGFLKLAPTDGSDPNTDPAKTGKVSRTDPATGSTVDPNTTTVTIYLWSKPPLPSCGPTTTPTTGASTSPPVPPTSPTPTSPTPTVSPTCT